jgi:two-component system LytT family sensor kinase
MYRLKAPVLLHISAWLIFLMLPFILMRNLEGAQKIATITASVGYWVSFGLYIFLFYFNAYFLIPRLYLQKKYLLYAGGILAALVVIYFVKHWIDHSYSPHGDPGMPGGGELPKMPFIDSLHPAPNNMPPQEFGNGAGRPPMPKRPVDLFTIFLLSTIWALSTAMRIIQEWRETEKRAIKAEADKANAELSFLKAQINPHFLFNTLNNIYSLAVKQSEHTAASIMKLSNIMRYVTDDVNQDFVALQSEVECITDYIDLQRLRLNKKVYIDFLVKGNTDGKRIPPLVLMTFIENVFKYGISSHEESAITIHIFSEEKSITFFCQNKVFSTLRRVERTGIGIANTKQRLEHLYPNRHLLNITSADGLYTVQLTIQV